MKKILGAVCCAWAISGSAWADETGLRAGLDVSVGGSSATGAATPLTSSFNYGIGGHIGYDINKYVTVAASLSATAGSKTGAIDVASNALTVGVTGFYPLADKAMAVYGSLGYGQLNTVYSVNTNTALAGSTSQGQKGLKLGAGIELGHGEKNSLQVGVETYDTGMTRVFSFVAGPVWKF